VRLGASDAGLVRAGLGVLTGAPRVAALLSDDE
jgi:hypothetical protein